MTGKTHRVDAVEKFDARFVFLRGGAIVEEAQRRQGHRAVVPLHAILAVSTQIWRKIQGWREVIKSENR